MNIKINGNQKLIAFGIACITLLECIALWKGINGTLLVLAVGTIAAAIGVVIPTPKWVKK